MEVKKEPRIRMGATRRNLFLGSKMKTNPSKTNSFSDQKGEVPNLKASFKKRADKIHLDSHEIAQDGRRQSDGNFFFVKIGFFSIKSPNSSRKSIKIIFF
jgi:hypothetical protein